ncbi:DUF6197 family protein [Mycobacteroides abscessus]|uniref:DUF6197 family protein n=1 Tax=Mycobacteroides abscessus TaxID=36809 RepID=UPI000C265C48|nr:hypothetical protein [Mycobacteroides abscessus]RIR09404.1 hypothetical protein D2E27_19365 [Mycobacteroides abscessus]RIS08443.1 hypothetical protein D2E58_03035 [Mycobacteroides abscessus]
MSNHIPTSASRVGGPPSDDGLTPELIVQKLREALSELRKPISPETKNGWAQGTYGLPYSCKCLDGALRYVVTWRSHGRAGDGLHEALRQRVAEVIADIKGVEIVGHPAPFIHAWNDEQGRVFAEVESVLERAIEHIEAFA